MKFQPVTHCIFDMDGTLLDTERIYTIATQEICQKYGKTFTWEIKQHQMGMTGKEAAEHIIKALELPITVEEYITQAQALYQKLMPECNVLPGVDKLIHHLHERGIPIAVATSSGAESVKIKTSHHKPLMSLFHHIVCASTDPEVEHGKPAPDIFLVCASRFEDNPDPKKCLVFEDAPNGVKAARAAGMQVVMTPDEQVNDDMKQDATIVLKSLEEFRPEWFGLPPF
ncbi:pseudouridine-5'-phosphatase-like isoform X1 [Schistocerca piceifrons]|uniref:pseudouridine-5'-phosphatase-like isoform X1 n=1 Tax=Schistocerca piceifrons TaxID=274613 RepID=UPI001F5F61CA|nr:pseudouridine-5'-phosphatase-like isoform X1 [Schistocerca piceifrons]